MLIVRRVLLADLPQEELIEPVKEHGHPEKAERTKLNVINTFAGLKRLPFGTKPVMPMNAPDLARTYSINSNILDHICLYGFMHGALYEI
jgi:hypothetical protein